MAGRNKKGKRKQMNLNPAHAPEVKGDNTAHASPEVKGDNTAHGSPEVQDDNISKLRLRELNQILLEKIRVEKKMKEELKEAERELRKEVAKKEEEHEAAISKADTQLQEAKHQVYVKENDKNKIEATVLQLKDQIQVISTESDARLKAWDLEKYKLRELSEQLAQKEQEHEAAISKVRTRLQEAEQEIQVKENECTAVISDKNKLEASVLHLKNQIQVISAESDARRKAWELEKDELLSAAKDEITKGSQIAEQAWNADKENLMSSLCRFEKQVEEMSELLLQCRAEKNELESELTETRERTQELVQKSELDRHLWDAEKRNSEDTLAELQAKLQLMAREKKLQSHINEDLSTEVLSLKDQLRMHNAKLVCMEEGSQMLKAMSASNAERLEAMSTQKETMENEIKRLRRQVNQAVNQRHPYSLHAEGIKKYRELEEKHRDLLNEKEEQGNITEPLQREIASLRSEKQVEEMSELLLQCRAEENELESELTESSERTQELVQKSELDRHVWDAEKRNSEDTLAELQAKLQLMAREKKLQSHINEDLSTEVLSLKDQLKIYNAKLVCMDEGSQMLKAMSASNAERLEAMSTQKETMENEIKRLLRQVNQAVNQHPYSLHAEGVKKYRELEEKHRELLNEKEEQGNIIESLEREIASLRSEKSLLSKSLDETTKMSQEISEKCLQNYHKVLELEGQSLELQTDQLAVEKSAYVELKNIRGDMNEISNDLHRIQREEVLDENF